MYVGTSNHSCIPKVHRLYNSHANYITHFTLLDIAGKSGSISYLKLLLLSKIEACLDTDITGMKYAVSLARDGWQRGLLPSPMFAKVWF